MRHSSYLLAGFLAMCAAMAFAQPYWPAMTELKVADVEGERDLSGFIWYPTKATGPETYDFESEVWVGTKVVKDATPATSRFPLVVLSHGMFGNAYNQAWLAGALARRGYIVAAVSHPGTSTWSRDPDLTRQLWERPKDISRVIDHATGASDFSQYVDSDRIYMAGHSLGGFTAVALAGARYDAAGLGQFCDTQPDELACGILSDWKIAQTPEDRAQMEADLSDHRIRAFAVFDLGGTQSFSEASLRQIDRPMLVFGAPIMNSGLTLDIESRALIAALPESNSRYIEPKTLSHFDFLGRCKPGGYELLAKEEPGDEIICSDGGTARAAKHEMIIDAVTDFFSNS
ncbi:Predicted dienelactone hydrolase [Ruegeria halocynthiae]|uniref:Predicted dienelactone hydrolase n=1 Tax=Ruegeria halocynthiae TaxID=985054 RepID=A0A1H3A7M2_9RHOB|nr:alpha/beta fold hydrolase [Ruegeria halocynthiae]SDX25742.1 Predicted dienelactone hydrolase [Ruegeria halocynthiae]